MQDGNLELMRLMVSSLLSSNTEKKNKKIKDHNKIQVVQNVPKYHKIRQILKDMNYCVSSQES